MPWIAFASALRPGLTLDPAPLPRRIMRHRAAGPSRLAAPAYRGAIIILPHPLQGCNRILAMQLHQFKRLPPDHILSLPAPGAANMAPALHDRE
jgi:hypothetical protein